jgi:methyltransferase
MTLFIVILSVVIVQRLLELTIASRNEKWMKEKGAIEFGKGHYPWMVLMHIAFFVSLIAEVLIFKRGLSPLWPLFLLVFLLAQAGRIWALASLGKYWNTKIIVLPGAEVVQKGPYRFIRHPNYLIVALELLTLPLIFQAYYTAILFMSLNFMMMSVRIPAEEAALKKLTEYEREKGRQSRFIPQMLKKFDN